MAAQTVTIRIPTGNMNLEEQRRHIERLFSGCFADSRPRTPEAAAAQLLSFAADLGAERV